MDNILSKIGLYDVFGVFMSGLIAVTVSIFLKLPIYFNFMDNDAENTICFLVICYFVGLILQEIGSFIEAKFTKFKKTAETKFLNEQKVFDNDHEMKEVEKIACIILNISEKRSFTEADNFYVYAYCLNYLEAREKEGKVKRINALYAMSRSLSCFMPICLWAYIHFFKNNLCDPLFWYVVVGICVTLALFTRRTWKFARYKVRVVFENYIAIKEKE